MRVREDDYEKAAELAEVALEATPAALRSEIAMDLTRIYLNSDRVEQAEKALKIANENAEKSRMFGLNGALRALEFRVQAALEGPVADAIEAEIVVAAENQDVFSQIDLARALIVLGRAQAGINALETVRREQRVGNIKTPDLFSALIAGYEALGQKQRAQETRQKIAAILAGEEEEGTFESATTSAAKSGVFSGQTETLKAVNEAIKARDYAGAIDLFTALIENKDAKVEKPALNFQNRGVLYMKIERYEEAAKDFAKALTMSDQLTPEENAAVHYNYVNALGRGGNYKKLEEEIENRLDAAEKSGEKFAHKKVYMRLLAIGAANQGNHAKSSDIYNQLIVLYPRDTSNYIRLSDSAMVVENFKQAISALSKGLEIDPDNLEMHERLLKIYQQLGDGENARRELKIINDLRSAQ